MQDNKKSPVGEADQTRRSTTRKMLLGGGALGVAAAAQSGWVKPVVDSALLPAHAVNTELAYTPG